MTGKTGKREKDRLVIDNQTALELASLVEQGLTTEQACHYLRLAPTTVGEHVRNPKTPEDEFLRDELLKARAADLLATHQTLRHPPTKGKGEAGAAVKAALGRLAGLDKRFKASVQDPGGSIAIYIGVPRPGDDPTVIGGIEIRRGVPIEEGARKSLEGGKGE